MITPAEMIEELLDSGAITKWEDSFLVSLVDRLDHDKPLTDLQLEKLQEIYDART